MPISPVLLEYQAKLRELQTGLDHARARSATSTLILVMACGALLLLGISAVRNRVPLWGVPLPIPIVAASAREYRKFRRASARQWRLRRFYERGSARLEGQWQSNGYSGDEFDTSGHPYTRDLNIFGDGSLFELLCIARTAIGRRSLAGYLSAAPSLGETLARQDAVRELRDRTALREQVAVLGEFDFSEARWETFAAWLDQPAAAFDPKLRVFVGVTSAITAVFIGTVLLGLLPWAVMGGRVAPLLVVQAGIGLLYRDRVARITRSIRTVALEIGVLREGVALVESQQFDSPKLTQLADRVRGASRPIRRLERLSGALLERDKEWFYIPSLPIMLGTQLSMAIEQWRLRHGAAFRGWLDAWGEFEALNAIANFAHENPAAVFPEFSEGDAHFEARSLGHPLLPDQTCVRNDVTLHAGSRFYIVSGSNMSGKSTLLRAVGLNSVLAFAGAPVRADAVRLSPLSICASISVTDSLLQGASKFLAEVQKLRQAIDSAAERPSLFLIDEILSGTNSRDRRAAVESVVRTLVERGAIGILSTHDLSLTEIACSELGGTNVHMGARDGADPLDFDYRLKPGVTTETNALAIARMAGVPV